MSELWISAFCAKSWNDPQPWCRFFQHCQEVMKTSLDRLDDKDPIRRKVASVEESAKFVCAFDASPWRWLFGRFSNKVQFSIRHNFGDGETPNSLAMHFPENFDVSVVGEVFDAATLHLSPFYSFADRQENVSKKNKSTGAVNLERELIGMFWLTFFGAAHVRFFGRQKFEGLSLREDLSGGLRVCLGETPSGVALDARLNAEKQLGERMFVDSNEFGFKPPGERVLTLAQLRLSESPGGGAAK